MPAMRSLAWAVGAALEDGAELDEEALALDADDDADGVLDDPHAASATTAAPAAATAPQRDTRVEVSMPSRCWTALYVR